MMTNRRIPIYLTITIALLVGLFTGRAILFNLAYLGFAFLIVNWLWSWFSVRGIAINRKTRTYHTQVGRTLDETFIVQNTFLLPKLWLEVKDESDLPFHRASHVVPFLGIRGSYRWYVNTVCTTRGEFHLGPMTIIGGDPFSLFVTPRKIARTTRVLVYPQIVPVHHFQLPMGMLSGGDAQRQRTHFITTNPVGVRDYVSGDSFNRIHWKTSARKDKLMVKEFELDPLVDVYLFVDFSSHSVYESSSIVRRNNTGPIISHTQLDHIPASTEEYTAVIAASLARYFIESQRSLGFVAYTHQREVHQAERGQRQLTRILQTLATARSLSKYTLAQMLDLEMPHLSRGATLVIVTSSTDTAWVTQAQILTRRGIKPVCVMIDPQSFGADKNPDTVIGTLQMAKIPVIRIRQHDDLTLALSQKNY